MKNHPFKNFIAYTLGERVIPQLTLAARQQYEGFSCDFLEKLDELTSVDPGSQSWRSVGFVQPAGAETLLYEVERGTYLLAVQHNERILPGKVRDEAVAKLVAEIEEREDRTVYRKEYAQLREEAEFTLLPRAFIRRTTVHVLFTDGFMFICTSSAKRADDTMVKIAELLGEGHGIRLVQTIVQPWELLNSVAHKIVSDKDENFTLHAADAAALAGGDKRTIRIKDRDIYGEEVQDLLASGYEPTELRMGFSDDEELLTFSLNDKFFFKRVQFDGTFLNNQEKPEDADAEMRSFTLLVARHYRDLVQIVTTLLGGIVKPAEKPKADAADEDDEL